MTGIKFRRIVIALATVCCLGFTGSSFASDPTKVSWSEIRLKDISESLPVFQLELKNTEVSQYFITIRNSEKRILFNEKLKGTAIVRKYKLYAEDISRTDGTTIEVTNKKTKEMVVYTITGNKIIEENVTDFKTLMRSLAIN